MEKSLVISLRRGKEKKKIAKIAKLQLMESCKKLRTLVD